MLCSLSAILTSTTRISSDIVSRSFRKFSACSLAWSPKTPPLILVSPSTMCAILSPKSPCMSSTV